jgi:AraC-like DNA-binding protein
MENRTNSIVLVRAEYVVLYIDLLRRLGTPVDRELRRARLPTLIEEMPDAWVSMDLTFRFIANCAHSEGIDDIGFEAGWDVSIEAFGDIMASTLQAAPTPKSRLEVFSRLLSLEDTGVRCELHPEGDMARICMPQYTPHGADSRIAEWLNLKAVIEVIRSWMGPDWLPPVIGLASRLPVSNSIRDRLPGIQILTGQSTPFIGVPSRVLSMPNVDDCRATVKNRMTGTGGYTSIVATEPANLEGRLSAALAPYLASGHPPIGLAAEIAGTSVRSLQRRLDRMQTSYTELVERLRFEQAVLLLRDSDLKILEIAIALGYGDASNFARALRRICGSSPRELRRQLLSASDLRSVA